MKKIISIVLSLTLILSLFTGIFTVNAEEPVYTVERQDCYTSGVNDAYSALVNEYGNNLLEGKAVYGKTAPYNDTIIAKDDWANITDGNPDGSASNVNIMGCYYPTMYFELDSNTRITQLSVFNYISWGKDLELCSFDVFVSSAQTDLWNNENMVIDYDVIENSASRDNNIIKFVFSETSNVVGKYVGIRYNDPCCFRTKNGTNTNNSIILSEIALFGEAVSIIEATAGEGGAISPAGNVVVGSNESKTFTITADAGYVISDVLVDGTSVGAVNSYTFKDVNANHTIIAKFAPEYTITHNYMWSFTEEKYNELVATYGTNRVEGLIPYSKYSWNTEFEAKTAWTQLTDGDVSTVFNQNAENYDRLYFELVNTTEISQISVFNFRSWESTGAHQLTGFEVYVSDVANTLFDESNRVIDYDLAAKGTDDTRNDLLKIEFSKKPVGKYVGFKWNNPANFKETDANGVVIAELALFGKEIKYNVETEYCYDSDVDSAYSALISTYGENLLVGKNIYGKTGPFDETIIAKSDWTNLTDGNPNGKDSNVNISANYYPTMYFELDALTTIKQLTLFNYISWGADLEICSFDVFVSNSIDNLWSNDNLVIDYDVSENNAQHSNNILKFVFTETSDVSGKYVGIRFNEPYNFRNNSSGVVLSEIALFGTEKASVTATSGAGGSISPSGETVVNKGESITYTFTPEEGLAVSDVMVDGVSVGAVNSYTFSNISGAHTISVTFAVPIITENDGAYDSGVVGKYEALISKYGENLAAGRPVYGKTSSGDVTFIEKTEWANLTDGNPNGSESNVNITASTYNTLYIELNKLTKVSQLSLFNYISWGTDLEIASFNVFMSADVETLWDDSNLVVDYDVSENTAQYANNIIKFAFSGDSQKYAKYIGIRWNEPYNFREGSAGIVLSEIAVFGKEYNAVSVEAQSGGTVSPSGIQPLDDNGEITINITPDLGYGIYDILVDGVSVGHDTAYTLSNVNSDQNISVEFYIIGDLDNDDMLAAVDLSILRRVLLGSFELEKAHTANINGDSEIDIKDLVRIKKMFAEGKSYINALSFEEQYEGAAMLTLDNSTALTNDFNYSGLYLGWGAFPDIYGRTYTKKEIQQELNTLEKMGYNNLRVSLSTHFAKYEYNSENGDWNWDSDEFQTFVYICKELKARGIDLTLTLMWDMEHNLKSAGVYVAEDYEATCENYAEYCYRLLTKLIENGVDNVEYILPFVEPYPSKDESELLFSGKYSNEIWRDTVSALDAKLKSENVRNNYKIIGPATTLQHIVLDTHNAKGFTVETWAQWYIDNCNDFIDIYAFHFYDTTSNDITEDTYETFYNAANEATTVFKSTGKSVWLDEYNFGYADISDEENYSRNLKEKYPLYGTHLVAEQIALMNCGISNSILWSIYDTVFPDNNLTNKSYENGIQKSGVLPAASESDTPYYAYYAVSLLSRYLSAGEGTESYKGIGNSGVHVSAIKGTDGTLTIVVVNMNTTSKMFDLSLNNTIKPSSIYRHLYNPETISRDDKAQIIGIDTIISNFTNRIVDTLPAGGVAVYTTSTK